MSQRVKITGDTIVYPYVLRNGVNTSSTTMSDGVAAEGKDRANRETPFIDARSGEYHDILMISGVNSSNQAIRLSIYEGFGGTSQFKIQMAASDSTQIFFQVPWNASALETTWYADYDVYGGVTNADDVTNTTVTLSAQYLSRI